MQTTHTPNPLQFGGVGVLVDRVNVAGAGETPDTNQLTRATTRKMRAAIVAGAEHPLVVQAVRDALAGAGIKDWTNHPAVCLAVWDWVRGRVRFVQDDDVLRAHLGMPDELELLIEPPVLLSMPSPAGDCDDFTMLTGAMLLSAGIPSVEITTICADGADPSRWSHVYLTARLGDGQRVVMDCSHGEYLGWEAPQYYDRRGWGAITATPAALIEHNQTIRTQGAQMHGLGDTTTAIGITRARAAGGNAYAFQRGQSKAVWNRPGVQPGRTLPTLPPAAGGNGLGAVDWNSIISQVTAGGLDIAKQITQKPGQYVQGPGSTVSYGVPGAAPYPGGGITVQTPIGSGTVGTGISGNVLLLGGVALVAFLMLAKR